MGHGGARKGAGRKAGSATKRTREIADAAAKADLTPLGYMLSVLQDDGQPMAVRFEAAKHSAPYVHPRLSSVDASVKGEMTVSDTVDRPPRETREEWLARRAEEMGPAAGAAN